MLGRLKFILYYWIIWILFFQLCRLLFVLYHTKQTSQLPFKTTFLSFIYGLRMDLSMSAYILIPVCLFVLLSVFIGFFRRSLLYRIYTYIILFFVLLVVTADLEIYKQWGFRIDATPLKFLDAPKEVWASISHLPVFWILLLFLIVFALLCRGFGILLHRKEYYLQSSTHLILTPIIVLAFTALLIFPIRGGIQLAPLNQSSVYFSKHHFANLAAINAPWNFIHGLLNKTSSKENPYIALDAETARSITDSLYASGHHSSSYLKDSTSNVIFILWESFTDKATHLTIDGKEVTPYFNQLKKEGIYFSQIYASGDRTDKGLSAVLSGYPSLHATSVIRTPNKASKLNTITDFFNSKGYNSSFFYGGEPEFANIKSYLLHNRFETLIEKDDFESKDQNSKWGAHDGVVSKRLQEYLSTVKQPFFSAWLTLSSHEPFETPVPVVFKGKEHATKFLNSIHYTDKVVYDFISFCKQQSWWQNTLVVIIADHGHPLPETNNKVDNFKIPMLWLGGALTRQGIAIDRIASQVDLAETITRQFTTTHPSLFPFSKNFLDTTSHQWAYFNFNNGFGFIQPGKQYVYDNVGRQLIHSAGNIDSTDIRDGKALQQFFMQDYIDK